MNYITLNNGVKMPQLGYGVYQVSQEECERCVLDAISVGYRAIDPSTRHNPTSTKSRWVQQSKNPVWIAKIFF